MRRNGHTKTHDQKKNPRAALAAGSRSLSCSTGKWSWPTRKGAKAAASNLRHRHAGATRPYQCGECGSWHVGHIPSAVVRGEVSATEFYEQRDEAQA